MSNCPFCQFENGEHSFECEDYVEGKIPSPKQNGRSKYWNEMVEALERHFLKGKSKERGAAICMLAEIEMLLQGKKI